VTATAPTTATSKLQLQQAYDALPPATVRATVLTMGSLHGGHALLMREARARVGPAGHVTVTVFVNPLQFGPDEDYESYPRDLPGDLQVCAREGVDLVFAPGRAEIYPGGDPVVRVSPGPLADVLEGAVRPDHFAGVLTIVTKLLNLTRPHLTVFGEKDFQQLALVRRLVADLDLGVQVIGAPIARDDDGVALSSRNASLTPSERVRAAAIPQALEAGRKAAHHGASADQVVAEVMTVLLREPNASVDYVVVTDPLLGPAPAEGAARLLAAVRLGRVRLLDNISVTMGGA
jgi:pantoate--beta-alanine ligase